MATLLFSPLADLTCPEPTVGPNVMLASTNGLQGWGRKLVYECASGYSLSDNMARRVRTCEMDGSWSGEAPICLGKSTATLSPFTVSFPPFFLVEQCQAPPPVEHAYIAPSKSMHNQGSTVHYTCQVGYTLEGSDQRTCGSNGVWTDEEPSCVCQMATSDPGKKTCDWLARDYYLLTCCLLPPSGMNTIVLINNVCLVSGLWL